MLNNIAALLDSGVTAAATDYESIATVTVGAGGSSAINFTSIAGTYSHLQIRYLARTTRADVIDSLGMRCNSDTGSNYVRHYLYADGSTASSGASTSQTYSNVATPTAASAASNIFGVGVIDVLDYASSNKYKTIRALSGDDRNGAGDVHFGSGLWMSTSAITSITLLAQGGSANFVQYSSFALYGIK